MAGISPKLPLKRSPEDGYWALNKTFLEVYEVMKDNLNITSIHSIGIQYTECDYPYTLDSPNWKSMQINYLKEGYESRSMR